MPKIDIKVLIECLEDIDEKLSLIWNDSHNYTVLTELELVRTRLRNIISTIEKLVP